MISHDYLMKLYNAKKGQGCVAFGFDKDGKRHFAVNGKATRCYKELQPVLNVFADSPIFCGYNFSFTVLRPYVSKRTLDETYDLIDNLDKKGDPVGFDLLPFRMYRKFPNSYFFDNRHFSCAEKKIIGYCEFMDITIRDLYTTKTPCFYCLPVVETVTFLTKKLEKKTIKKSSGPYSIGDGLTYYLYREY